MFRFKRSVPVSYDRQGLVYFTSKLYKELDAQQQKTIRRLCKDVGGEYAKALFEFVTTNTGAKAVCAKYFLSRSTLERITKKYYIAFLEES